MRPLDGVRPSPGQAASDGPQAHRRERGGGGEHHQLDGEGSPTGGQQGGGAGPDHQWQEEEPDMVELKQGKNGGGDQPHGCPGR